MAKTFVIEGNKELRGEIRISGSKNCALCLIAGAIMTDAKVTLRNIPDIEDIRALIRILKYLNADVTFGGNTLTVDASSIQYRDLNIEEVGRMRASYYLIGALIHRFGHLEIARSGGCTFVRRPINYHLDLLRYFGVETRETEEGYAFRISENKGGEYTLPYPSFGTTVNALLFAVSGKEDITFHNICTEIEIRHFIDLLKRMGAEIHLEGTTAFIHPVKLSGTDFTNIPDRIESGTFLLMGPTVCRFLRIKNFRPDHNKALLDMFSLLDIDYQLEKDQITLQKTAIQRSCFIETGIGDAISSDLQPLLTVFCLNIPRISVIREKVYSSRFTHIDPLRKMGGFVSESSQNILINGIMKLIGQEVIATDLRMAAAMVFAALSAEGTTTIHHVDYIDRGYENIVEKLTSLGADIKVYEEK